MKMNEFVGQNGRGALMLWLIRVNFSECSFGMFIMVFRVRIFSSRYVILI